MKVTEVTQAEWQAVISHFVLLEQANAGKVDAATFEAQLALFQREQRDVGSGPIAG